MNEIGEPAALYPARDIALSDCWGPIEEAPPENWRRIGQISFFCLAFIASITAFGAHRKRTIVVMVASAGPQTVALSTASVEEAAPLPNEPIVPYSELPCDGPLVYQVIHPIGSWSLLELGWNRRELQNLGMILRQNTHPYKFLETIFRHPELRATVQGIFASNGFVNRQKQNGFLEGVEWGMLEYGRRGRVLCYVDDFARTMGGTTSADSLRRFIQQRDWDNLVRHLCQRSGPPAA